MWHVQGVSIRSRHAVGRVAVGRAALGRTALRSRHAVGRVALGRAAHYDHKASGQGIRRRLRVIEEGVEDGVNIAPPMVDANAKH